MDKEKILTNNLFVFILAAVACALWGTAFPFLKLSFAAFGLGPTDTYPELLFAAYRFFLAGLMVFGFSLLRGETIKLQSKQDWWAVFILGLFQTSLQYFFFYVGLAHTAGMKASVIGASGSFFAVIVSHFVYTNDRIDLFKIIGLITGFAGVILVNLHKGSFDLDFRLVGEGFLVFSALASTIGSVVAKKVSSHLSPILLTAYQFVVGSIFLFIVAVSKISPTYLKFNAFTGGMLVYLAFLSASAFAIWYVILKYNPLGKIAIYRFLIPVFGVIFSAAFLKGEHINSLVILALGLVSVGIIAVNYQGMKTLVQARQKQ